MTVLMSEKTFACIINITKHNIFIIVYTSQLGEKSANTFACISFGLFVHVSHLFVFVFVFLHVSHLVFFLPIFY